MVKIGSTLIKNTQKNICVSKLLPIFGPHLEKVAIYFVTIKCFFLLATQFTIFKFWSKNWQNLQKIFAQIFLMSELQLV